MSDPPRPHVVMISPSLPETRPEHAGGRFLADVVDGLVAWARVSVVVPDGPAVRRAEPLPALHRVVVVPHPTSGRFQAVEQAIERFVLTGSTPRWFRRALREYPAALELLCSADIVDLQWGEQGVLIPWLRTLNPQARVTLTLHDVMSQREARSLAAVRDWSPRQWAARARWVWARRRAVAAESRVTGRANGPGAADAIAVLSRKDEELLPDGSVPVTVVSPPLAETYAHVRRTVRSGRAELLLVAYLARWANEEGLTWFVRSVLPLIKEHVPQVRLRVAGTGIRPTVRVLEEDPAVDLMGFVDDLDALYEIANVAVVPLLQGAGVKFKVVDALSAGMPVVTTSVGAEGIGDATWFAGVVDDPRRFADAVVAVLRDQDRAEKRAQQARDAVLADFGRPAFVASLRDLYGVHERTFPNGPRPAVSVVIPAYNAARVIERQLRALAEQVGAPAFEVVVADNRSNDDTAAVSRRWSDRFPCGLRVVRAFGRQGVSHARNMGIAQARADKVLICDADDAVAPNWVSAMSRGLDEADLVGSALLRVTPGTRRDDGDLQEPVRTIFNYVPYVTGSALGCTKAVWKAVRGFDEAFPAGHEEVDFCWRAQEAGFRLAGVNDTHIEYSQRESPKEMVRQYRNYAQGAMLLWTRYADHGPMPPVSFVGSLRGAVNLALKNWRLLLNRGDLQSARNVGWAWGTVRGHVKYRIAGKPPAPRLWRVD